LFVWFYLGYGEYFFKDVPLSAEEHFNDLARGEMAKKKVEKPTHEFWWFRRIHWRKKNKRDKKNKKKYCCNVASCVLSFCIFNMCFTQTKQNPQR